MKELIRTVAAKVAPRRFTRHMLSTHLSGIYAIEPAPLHRAIEEAKDRIAATPGAEIRRLATEPRADRAPMLELEPMEAEQAPAPGMLEPPPVKQRACIPIVGTIISGDASCARMMGIEATGLDEIAYALRFALAEPTVAEIVLCVKSPGGVATGVQEVVDLIAAGTKRKPINASIRGQCASAALWLVSACTSIEAEPSALVGSIGVYSVVDDSSKAAEDAGVKVHVVRSGPQKGVGEPGAPITEPQLAAIQVVVNDLAALFVGAIAEGRGFASEKAQALATGDIWIASKALELGLIDAITRAELDDEPADQHQQSNAAAALAGAETIAREGGDHAAQGSAVVQEDGMSEEKLSAFAARIEALEAKDKERAQTIATLQTENAQLKAEATARAAANAAATERRKAEVIDAGVKAGRVVPSMRAAVEAYAGTVGDDLAKLESFIASLPVQVTPHALGANGDQGANGDGKGGKLEDQDAEVAALFGLTPEQMQAAGSVDFISLDGKSGGKIVSQGPKGPVVKRVEIGSGKAVN